MDRLIFHIDVNSAFLSWEAARRVRNGEEDIRLVPSAVGGDRDKRTGVILAKSGPAKKYGVKTGEPVSAALRKCPSLILAKPDFRLYEQNSHAFMDICREYAPVLEKYSIDECFLDMSGTSLMYPDPVALAFEIKERIKNELGFTVNIGIGPNKLLAKMASDFEKPDRVHTLFADEIPQKMWSLPIDDLFLVGRNSANKLRSEYITTIGELAAAPLSRIQHIIGVKFGKQLHDYANGIDDSPVASEAREAKGYSISATLEEDVTTFEEAKRILLMLADSISARMRSDKAQAYCVSVTIRANDFKNRSHQSRFEEATDITSEISSAAVRLFTELWDKKTPLRLLGIALTDVTRDDNVQMSLFPSESREKARRVDKAVDTIRKKYGSKSIMRASSFEAPVDVGKKYKAQMELKNAGNNTEDTENGKKS